jgi:hypothetical protein
MSGPDASAKQPETEEPAGESAEADAPEAAEVPSAKDDGGPLGKGLPWKSQRAEIAEEPGNHGRFALGCSIVVAVVLIGFFVIRLYVMR